jgi:hypothetical protein
LSIDSAARSSSTPLPTCGLRRIPATSTLQTRYSFLDQPDLPRPRPPLPFRTVTSLRIKAFCRIAARQPAFRFRPISVRSPPPVSITSCGYGSTFPVRYVLGGLLFLKPLGTFITMRLIRFFVKMFLFEFALISSAGFCFILNALGRDRGASRVDKTRRGGPVL